MFELIPTAVRERWPLYFEIETPDSEARERYRAIYETQLSDLSRSAVLDQNQEAQFTILTPPKSHTTVTRFGDFVAVGFETEQKSINANGVPVYSSWQGSRPEFFNWAVTAIYDARLCNVSGSPEWLYRVKSDTGWYLPRYASAYQRRIVYSPYYRGHLAVTAKPFTGLQSLAYLLENGGTVPDIEVKTAKTVLAYISGAQTFGSEIEFQISAYTQAQIAETGAFAQDIADRQRRDLNDIEAQRLAITLAVENEQKSAIRDMQGILIAAAGLRL